MDLSLAHLPERKRDELRKVTAIIRAHCPAAQLILLFGSYARGDWKEVKDLVPDRRSGHVSDYDILVVLEQEAECDSLVWHQIEQACSEAGLSAYPRVIHHGINYLNRKLEQGQYFFSDIVAEGKILYDSGALTLAKPKELSREERLEIARNDFTYWFTRAEQFFEGYAFNHSKEWRELAAFNLHQASESCYKTMLLVFTGYIPDEPISPSLVARSSISKRPLPTSSPPTPHSSAMPLRCLSTPTSAPATTSVTPLTKTL